MPDVKGRQEILELYIDKITHDSAINVNFWAKKTAGFSGADIQNLVNTAAIHAAAEGMYLISNNTRKLYFLAGEKIRTFP